MNDASQVRDENLRLVHSPGHGEWLRRQLRDRYLGLLVAGLVTLVSVVWLGVSDSGDMTGNNIVYVDVGETQEAITALEAEGYMVIVGKPKSQEAADGIPPALSFALTYLPFVLIGVAALAAIKTLADVRRIRQWQRDHAEFLAGYGREAD